MWRRALSEWVGGGVRRKSTDSITDSGNGSFGSAAASAKGSGVAETWFGRH